MTTRLLMVSALAIALAACGGEKNKPETDAPAETDAQMSAPDAALETEEEVSTAEKDTLKAMSLAEVVTDIHRRGGDAMARDPYRHPVETLEFFGLEPEMTVVEVSPGGGWYTDILAPYIGTNGGTYIAASYDPASSGRARERLDAFEAEYMQGDLGDIQLTVFTKGAGPIAPDGTADMVLTFRNVHNWIMGGYAEESFAKFHAALKPGGVLGVVEHRLPEDADAERERTSGYVKESMVIALAEAAGFVLDEKSEVNANPADTADHPFGVWTLQPSSRTTDREGNTPEGFDAAAYRAIGESDRMTLRFVKPAE